MFTSLKVVRMALVDCDCSRRSATRARRRLIGTRCSGRSPKFCCTGAATAGKAGLAAAGAVTGAGTAAGLAGTAEEASTSPLVTRPSLPVPVTSAAVIPLSASSLAAAGMATSLLLPPVAGAAAATGVAAAVASLTTAFTSSGLIWAEPSVSMRAMTSSLTTLSPSFFTSCAMMPALGAGTSSTTLSVSISTRISSMATASPGFFFQVSRVPSATDSDSCGTLTSTMAMMSVLSVLGARARRCSGKPRTYQRCLLGQDETLELAEGLIEQRLLLLLVQVGIATGGRGRGRAAGVSQLLTFAPCSRAHSAGRRTRHPGSAARPGTRRCR